ncbi:MAG TPA: hypothetical protein VFH68_05885 [Polyangia bacterium]|jgi:hypothetical protein|nr:hypothetical protein [Polyangia bacterium]
MGLPRVVRIAWVVFLLSCGAAAPVTNAPTAAAAPARPTGAPLAPSQPSPPRSPPVAAPVVPGPGPVARQLAQDETITTASGATLTVLKGWFVTVLPALLILEDPDRQLKAALVEIAAPDRAAAVAGAWSRFRPGFALPIARAVDRPGRDGWDAVAHVAYVTKVEENRAVMADARRKAATWYVGLYDGPRVTLDRRGAELAIAMRSLEVASKDK